MEQGSASRDQVSEDPRPIRPQGGRGRRKLTEEERKAKIIADRQPLPFVEVLKLLSEGERAILVLRCQGKTGAEVAKERYVEEHTIKQLTSRLIVKLRRGLPDVSRPSTGSQNIIIAACYRVGVLKGRTIERKAGSGG